MENKIIEIIQNACALDEEITLDSELKLLSIDSLSFVGAIVEMEETFGIEFDIDELDVFDWKTVGDIVQAIKEKCNAEK